MGYCRKLKTQDSADFRYTRKIRVHHSRELFPERAIIVEKCSFSSLTKAEAIRTTVVPITPLIRTTVVPISGVIGPTVVRIANATGIGYRHDGRLRFSNKLTYALNCKFVIK